VARQPSVHKGGRFKLVDGGRRLALIVQQSRRRLPRRQVVSGASAQ
jgi:hypothetical protein